MVSFYPCLPHGRPQDFFQFDDNPMVLKIQAVLIIYVINRLLECPANAKSENNKGWFLILLIKDNITSKTANHGNFPRTPKTANFKTTNNDGHLGLSSYNFHFCSSTRKSEPSAHVHRQPGLLGDRDVDGVRAADPLADSLRRLVAPRALCLQTCASNSR